MISIPDQGFGTLGINGLGRIGKLTVWFLAACKRFDHLIVNLGREVGQGLEDLIHYLEHDSTYGQLGKFLHGIRGEQCIEIMDREARIINLDGVKVTFLTQERNPLDIGWGRHGASVVVDTTGRFQDPTLEAEHPGGSLRGHLEAGARVVLNSSAFKIKNRKQQPPEDSVTLIHGINNQAFDPSRHAVISAASCTTTALAHMLLPLLNNTLTSQMMTAAISTVHASTNSQSVLDCVPARGASDLRKTRSIFNNIILTSTNAAQALEQVMPEISRIGFLADSVRIPTTTASIIILNCTFQTRLDQQGDSLINRDTINRCYRDFSLAPNSGLKYSENQNVSTDIIGELSVVTIEGTQTHTRTGIIDVSLEGLLASCPEGLDKEHIEVPVTHAKIFGWYDNELGSYTKRMCELISYIADQTG